MPFFRLRKSSKNFLGFEFLHYAPEAGDLRDARSARQWRLIEQIRQLANDGWTVREIAAELAMSKSAVHRYLGMSEPPVVTGGFRYSDMSEPPVVTGGFRYSDISEPPAVTGGLLCVSPHEMRAEEEAAPEERYPGEHTDMALIQMGYRSEARRRTARREPCGCGGWHRVTRHRTDTNSGDRSARSDRARTARSGKFRIPQPGLKAAARCLRQNDLCPNRIAERQAAGLVPNRPPRLQLPLRT